VTQPGMLARADRSARQRRADRGLPAQLMNQSVTAAEMLPDRRIVGDASRGIREMESRDVDEAVISAVRIASIWMASPSVTVS
jgi:hypothetical protein